MTPSVGSSSLEPGGWAQVVRSMVGCGYKCKDLGMLESVRGQGVATLILSSVSGMKEETPPHPAMCFAYGRPDVN